MDEWKRGNLYHLERGWAEQREIGEMMGLDYNSVSATQEGISGAGEPDSKKFLPHLTQNLLCFTLGCRRMTAGNSDLSLFLQVPGRTISSANLPPLLTFFFSAKITHWKA